MLSSVDDDFNAEEYADSMYEMLVPSIYKAIASSLDSSALSSWYSDDGRHKQVMRDFAEEVALAVTRYFIDVDYTILTSNGFRDWDEKPSINYRDIDRVKKNLKNKE